MSVNGLKSKRKSVNYDLGEVFAVAQKARQKRESLLAYVAKLINRLVCKMTYIKRSEAGIGPLSNRETHLRSSREVL